MRPTIPGADPSLRLELALLEGDRSEAAAALEAAQALAAGHAVDRILVPVLEHIGAEWELGRLALSQVYLAGRICEELAESLLPAAGAAERPARAIGIAVLEDHHVLGKRIVAATARAAGWRVEDLGHGHTAEALAALVAERGIRVLLVSTLMLRAALQVEPLVRRLRGGGTPVRVLVGGAPFRLDPGLWREVGADAMGHSASDALPLLERYAAEGT